MEKHLLLEKIVTTVIAQSRDKMKINECQRCLFWNACIRQMIKNKEADRIVCRRDYDSVNIDYEEN